MVPREADDKDEELPLFPLLRAEAETASSEFFRVEVDNEEDEEDDATVDEASVSVSFVMTLTPTCGSL